MTSALPRSQTLSVQGEGAGVGRVAGLGDKLSGQVKSRLDIREWDRHSRQRDMAHTEEQGGKGECYRCRRTGHLVSLELWLKAAGATKEESGPEGRSRP